MDIKLLATDLDRTLLTVEHRVSDENRAALEACADKGILLVAATGRALSAVPEAVRAIRGVRYLICANGSKIYDNVSGELLCERYLDAEAIEYVMPMLKDNDVLLEFFWDGFPWVDAERYRTHAGIPDWFLDYFRQSRKPLEDLEAGVRANIHRIENVNFVFGTEDVKQRIHAFLQKGERLYELTSSLAFNFEIGGRGVSKATALDFVAQREALTREQCICFGDSENDASMIAWAGIGVAVDNAEPVTKEAADYITLDCEHSGVAAALKALEIL